MLVPLTAILAILTLTLATPTPVCSNLIPRRWVNDLCPPGAVAPTLLQGLAVPGNKTLNLVTVGRGVQDYNCDGRRFVSNGARAK